MKSGDKCYKHFFKATGERVLSLHIYINNDHKQFLEDILSYLFLLCVCVYYRSALKLYLLHCCSLLVAPESLLSPGDRAGPCTIPTRLLTASSATAQAAGREHAGLEKMDHPLQLPLFLAPKCEPFL